jgi:hypothetical protein
VTRGVAWILGQKRHLALGVASALLTVFTGAGCSRGGGPSPIGPSPSPSPSGTPAPPRPSGATSGVITNPQAVADIITYNQNAVAGSSFRRTNVITRWELPVPVFVDASASQTVVEQSLRYWQSLTGITFGIVGNAEPRIFVRTGTDGLGAATGRGVVDGVYADNRARSALVVIVPTLGSCNFADVACAVVYEHELGHALGMLDHTAGGGIMSGGTQASAREIALLTELYRLPHGAHVDPDGSWRVVP